MIDVKYKIILEDVNFHKDKENDCYLSLKYKSENPDGSIDQITIPSVRLPISKYMVSISMDNNMRKTIDCGFGDLPITKGRVKTQKGETLKDVYYVVEKIKDAQPKEMTLDEIEKQLGHKVKIINRKEGKT